MERQKQNQRERERERERELVSSKFYSREHSLGIDRENKLSRRHTPPTLSAQDTRTTKSNPQPN